MFNMEHLDRVRSTARKWQYSQDARTHPRKETIRPLLHRTVESQRHAGPVAQRCWPINGGHNMIRTTVREATLTLAGIASVLLALIGVIYLEIR